MYTDIVCVCRLTSLLTCVLYECGVMLLWNVAFAMMLFLSLCCYGHCDRLSFCSIICDNRFNLNGLYVCSWIYICILLFDDLHHADLDFIGHIQKNCSLVFRTVNETNTNHNFANPIQYSGETNADFVLEKGEYR